METDELIRPRPEVIPRFGKDEMNLAEFPITLLSDRVPAGMSEIVYQDQIYDTSLGRTIDRKLTITAPEKYGLPTAIDDDVLLAMVQLTNRANGFTSREVSFTRYELSELLQWPINGQNYNRLITSLRRWTSAYLDYENAWWDKRKMTWTTSGFHILDNFELSAGRGKKDQGELFSSSIAWNKVVFASFEAGYLKSIDYELYKCLKNQVAKRLYRFLSKRFYLRDDFTMSLRDLAFAHVGISQNYKDAGKIKEKLQTGLEELEAIGFLGRLKREERYQKTAKEWTIRLVEGRRRPKTDVTTGAFVPPPDDNVQPLGIVKELVIRDVSRSRAEELIRQYPAERINSKIEVFDWLLSRKDKRIQKSPAGYLVKSIEDDYAAPKGFKSKAQQGEEATAKQEAQRRELDATRRKQEQEAREKKDRQELTAKVDAFLAKLSPEDRKEFEQQALAAAGSDGRFFRDALIREHVIKLLELATDA